MNLAGFVSSFCMTPEQIEKKPLLHMGDTEVPSQFRWLRLSSGQIGGVRLLNIPSEG